MGYSFLSFESSRRSLRHQWKYDAGRRWGVGVGASDAEVVELAAVAQCEFAELSSPGTGLA